MSPLWFFSATCSSVVVETSPSETETETKTWGSETETEAETWGSETETSSFETETWQIRDRDRDPETFRIIYNYWWNSFAVHILTLHISHVCQSNANIYNYLWNLWEIIMNINFVTKWIPKIDFWIIKRRHKRFIEKLTKTEHSLELKEYYGFVHNI